MKAIKVNADYESVLFRNKPLPLINESLEFLAFYLDDRPLLTRKKYPFEYLKHIESIVGHQPRCVSQGDFENWWGPLTDLEVERELNSKLMSSTLCSDTLILKNMSDLPSLGNKIFLAKNPFGMSGQNFAMVGQDRLENLEQMLKNGPVVLEPFFDRQFDFSHYIFPNGISICYQNIVDKKFQYRGTIFRDYTSPILSGLKFYPEISRDKWEQFQSLFGEIVKIYSTSNARTGFSIDSFIYSEDGELKIRGLSEVNYRRTMGAVAFELAVKYSGIRRFCAFLLSKSNGLNFSQLKEKLSPIAWRHDLSRGVMLLSPGNVRYDMFLISALNEAEGKVLLSELKLLLPDSEFSVEF